MKEKYKIMNREILRRGIRKSVIARAMGITPQTLSNKLCGKSGFTWNEVCLIQSRFFPDISKDRLMEENDKDRLMEENDTV